MTAQWYTRFHLVPAPTKWAVTVDQQISRSNTRQLPRHWVTRSSPPEDRWRWNVPHPSLDSLPSSTTSSDVAPWRTQILSIQCTATILLKSNSLIDPTATCGMPKMRWRRTSCERSQISRRGKRTRWRRLHTIARISQNVVYRFFNKGDQAWEAAWVRESLGTGRSILTRSRIPTSSTNSWVRWLRWSRT